MAEVNAILERLEGVKRSGNGWVARCPGHDDTNPSLSISTGDDGRVLLKCFAGCTAERIVKAIGLGLRDLMPDNGLGVPVAATQSKKPPKTWPTPEAVVEAARWAINRDRQKSDPPKPPMSAECPVTTNHYHRQDGAEVGLVVRFDPPDGKQVRQASRNGDGWTLKAMPGPRPLYRLPEVIQAESVLVVEGEKSADAAAGLGFIATTSAGGSNAAAKTDWSPLAGKQVVILPDNDEPGERYASDVIEALSSLIPRPTVRLVRIDGLPPGGDIADWLGPDGGAGCMDEKEARQAIVGMVDRADAIDFDHSMVIDDPDGGNDWRPFPLDALPDALRGFVQSASASIGCDPSFIALPALTALAAAVGNSREIAVRQDWREPMVLWSVLVGESGCAKSPALDAALAPVHARQQELSEKYKVERQDYERNRATYNAAQRANGKRGGDFGVALPPTEPKAERVIANDITTEAVAVLLSDNSRGVLIARDELSGWLSFDRYVAGGRGGDSAHWLAMFGARPLSVDRKTSEPIFVERAAVSVVGGIQPGVLGKAIERVQGSESGLLARLLLAYPPRQVKLWAERSAIHRTDQTLYDNLFECLYQLEPDVDANGRAVPGALTFDPEAGKAFGRFYDQHNVELAGLVGTLAACWSKLEAYCARLAGLLHLIRWASGETDNERTVGAESVEGAVELVRWFGQEARRVYGVLAESPADQRRRRALELIRRSGGTLTTRDLQRALSLPSRDDARAILRELEAAGHGRLSFKHNGGRTSEAFVMADKGG